jgi:hypothetical protein
MAMIVQARSNSAGGQTTEGLRRQIAMLHLRFYAALFVALLLAFYVGDRYRIAYGLLLYSFWIPQIVLNVITESKNAMHRYFIYGMSLSRLVVPLYMFGVRNNFLKEVYPESPTDLWMCQLLTVWVGVQVAVLIAQSKYGARFMIPARFLPPKFDYSRPLPASLLQQNIEIPTSECIDTDLRGSPAVLETEPLLVDDVALLHVRGRHPTAPTTRNRIHPRGIRSARSERIVMTAEPVKAPRPLSPPRHALDCSICYDSIDIDNRTDYMLAPCDHIFHKACLTQWMDVKMECPICRTELPAL